MQRNHEPTLWLGAAVLAAGLLLDLLLLGMAGIDAARMVLPLSVAALLVCGVSAWHERLKRLTREELRDRSTDGTGTDSSSLFTDPMEVATPFSAEQRLRSMERLLLPVIPFILALLCAGGAYGLAASVRGSASPGAQGPLAVGFLAVQAFVTFLIHRILLAMSRRPDGEGLRAAAIWLGLAALAICAAAATVLVDVWAETALTRPILWVAAALLSVLSVESTIQGVASFYQARRTRRRIPASRLGALLCDPAAWAHSLAGALDYQFGFKISETAMFRLGRRMLLPLLGLQGLLLLVSHCMVIIEPHEAAAVDVMGRLAPDRILRSGFHLVWPPPLNRVRRYPVHRIQTLAVGFHHDEPSATDGQGHDHGHDHGQATVNPAQATERGDQIKLWSEHHHDDEYDFLVAAREAPDPRLPAARPSGGAVPVNLLSISMLVEFQVTDLGHYLTRHRDPVALLRQVALQALMRATLNADVFDLMGSGQRAFAARLTDTLQERVNALVLGVEIRAVHLLGVHPPVEVAAAYEAVIGADDLYETAVLEGETYRIRRLPAAAAEAHQRRRVAEARRDSRAVTAAAEAALFLTRVDAASSAPPVYATRAIMDVLETRLPETTRHVVIAAADAETVQIDLETKPFAALLDAASRLEAPAP